MDEHHQILRENYFVPIILIPTKLESIMKAFFSEIQELENLPLR